MKNGIAYKNQNVYLKINIYLNQASTLQGQCCHYVETTPVIYGANRLDGFYIMATLD